MSVHVKKIQKTLKPWIFTKFILITNFRVPVFFYLCILTVELQENINYALFRYRRMFVITKAPMNALRVTRDFCCTKKNVLVCMDQLKL